jgi:hypothetical protein
MASENPSIEQWGSVVFLDRLGTKESWKNEPEATLDHWSDFNEWTDMYLNSIKTPERLETWQLQDIRKIAFSDTFIMTIPQRDNTKPIQRSLEVIGEMLTHLMFNALEREIFFRGCISLGKFYASESMIIGPAVNEAYRYHSLPQWIGISAAPSAHYYLSTRGGDLSSYPYESAIAPYGFVRYSIPLRNTPEYDGWAVNWAEYDIKGNRVEHRRDVLRQHWEGASDIDVAFKYRNTIAFLNDMVRRHPLGSSP